MNDNFSIRVKNMTKRFGAFTAVDSINFDVRKGEIFGFLGANGAGKTTAMRMLCGLLRATSGEAMVAGYDVIRQPDEVKRRIGYMSQKFSLYEQLTARENIRFYGGIYGLEKQVLEEKSTALIRRLGMENDADSMVNSLPLGWKQKLAFMVALLHDPQIVFLDEPTGGVDPITRRQFWELIYQAAEQGTTVFVTTHYMDEAEYCDRVSIMVDGRIAAMDAPLQLREQFQTDSMNDVFYQLARAGKRKE